MEHKRLDGHLFAKMILSGSALLKSNVKRVDDLNVFPVPDGDTGTNMNLSLSSGANELAKNPSAHLGKAAQALSKGLLMGARGNSGVILSQLFRGFGKAVSEKESVDAVGFSEALQQGVEAAYKAVMKPVEGTILTVAKEAAKAGIAKAKKETNITLVMHEVLKAAKEALAKTPQQLPVLRQVGVVDAGGQGLVFVYEGFLSVLRGEQQIEVTQEIGIEDDLAEVAHHQMPAQVHLSSEDIEFGYCTEFIVGLNKNQAFDEFVFREKLSNYGDSLLVIADDELVKVHIHAEYPGEVLTYAQNFGDLKKIKIENMREQHQTILSEEEKRPGHGQAVQKEEIEKQPYGILAVAAGEGLGEIFRSLGADTIIQGGQTMNPSTEDIVTAVHSIHAEKVIVLPNNSNIIMAAQQAKDLVNIPLEVIPTKTIPQGMASLLAFDPSADLEKNTSAMTLAIQNVKTGLVTYAVRDSKFGDLEIKEGNYLGILEGEIVVSEPEHMEVAKALASQIIDEDSAVLTIIYGEDTTEEAAKTIAEMVESEYPDVEVEVLSGGQPVYSFIYSVE